MGVGGGVAGDGDCGRADDAVGVAGGVPTLGHAGAAGATEPI